MATEEILDRIKGYNETENGKMLIGSQQLGSRSTKTVLEKSSL